MVRVRQRASSKFLQSGPSDYAPNDGRWTRRPPSVHHSARPSRLEVLNRCSQAALRVSVPTSTERPRGLLGGKGVEQRDRVFAPVAGEVAIVAVDHRQARAHEAGEAKMETRRFHWGLITRWIPRTPSVR